MDNHSSIENKLRRLERSLNCKTRFYDNFSQFPEVGVSCALFVDKSNGNIYVWSGTEYILNGGGSGDGAQGIQGIQGLTGDFGIQGIQGFEGVQGIQGLIGIQGPSDGAQGTQGIQGIQGRQGAQGAQGTQGRQGTQGTQSVQGIQGIQGLIGFQGIQGIIGSQGLTGIQGPSDGAQGTQGIQGIIGIQGPSDGAQGIQGIQGIGGSRSVPIDAETGTPYTLELLDANAYKPMSHTSTLTINIPDNATVAFPIGTVITFEQRGAGQLTISGNLGVTVYGNNESAGQYFVIQAIKTDTDTWVLIGGV